MCYCSTHGDVGFTRDRLSWLADSLVRLGRFDVVRVGISSSKRTDFIVVGSLFFVQGNPPFSPPPPLSLFLFHPISPNSMFIGSIKASSHSSSSSSLPDLPIPSRLSFPFLKKNAGAVSERQKAIASLTVILLSALIVILIHPVSAPPAYAILQTAAKTGFSSASSFNGRIVRTGLLTSAWTGFFASCLHTLSGPDHLAALAPLSIGCTRMESALIGALWGCGHDAGQVILGLLFLLLKEQLHIEVICTWGTRVVAFTLLVIGAMGIREASESHTPCVVLENVECDGSVYKSLETPIVGKKKIGFATFAAGIVNGLQPDSLMMVLPALTLPSRVAGAAFLGMFLIGTVVAMGTYTVFIGSCSQALKDRVPRVTEKLTWASSFVAIAFGVAILISQFFGFSLY